MMFGLCGMKTENVGLCFRDTGAILWYNQSDISGEEKQIDRDYYVPSIRNRSLGI